MKLNTQARFFHYLQKLPLHYFAGDFCPIFMLHRIKGEHSPQAGHDPAYIDWCLNYLTQQGYQPISLSHLVHLRQKKQRLPRKSVVFTIDDGFRDNIVDAGYLFARHKVPLTCFVVSGLASGELWPWDDQLSYFLNALVKGHYCFDLPDTKTLSLVLDDAPTRTAACDELRDKLKAQDQSLVYAWVKQQFTRFGIGFPRQAPMAYQGASMDEYQRFLQQGHSLCPHTHTHRILSQLSDEQALAEIQNSQSWLTKHLGAAEQLFAYPTGRSVDFGEREVAYLRMQGIIGAVSTEARSHTPSDNLYALPRFSLPSHPHHFIQYLSYIEPLKQRFRAVVLRQ